MGYSHEESPVSQERGVCRCPFCDNALKMPYPFCQACGSKVEYCPVCGQPLPAEGEACPHCAQEER